MGGPVSWRDVPFPLFDMGTRPVIHNLMWNAISTRGRAEEISLGIFNPEEPYIFVARASRLRHEVEWAFFLLAFNSVESWLLDLVGEADSRMPCSEALAKLCSDRDMARYLVDYDSMSERLRDYQALRNEIVHRNGRWNPRPVHLESMNRLVERETIAAIEDPEAENERIIGLIAFERLFGDLKQVVNVCESNLARLTGLQ